MAIKVAHVLEKEPLRKDANELRSELYRYWYEQAVVGYDWCSTPLVSGCLLVDLQ
jgi:hypothetical protein